MTDFIQRKRLAGGYVALTLPWIAAARIDVSDARPLVPSSPPLATFAEHSCLKEHDDPRECMDAVVGRSFVVRRSIAVDLREWLWLESLVAQPGDLRPRHGNRGQW
jgi:hypothetical protein